MIYVYTNKQDSENWILQNDWYFNLYTNNEKFTEEDKAVIWQIDHAKLTEDKHIETKYGLGTIRNLSSGCKTMLNVMKNPQKIVNADECGQNVLDILFSMDGISLYMSRPERIHIKENVEICFNNADVVTGRVGYEHWWSEEYARRIRMIYDTIKFEADPFSYFLEFADRITLVRGDSATGKTYLYQMLEDLRMTKEYQAIKLFNYKTEDFHENLKKCKDRFVVIDNADLLLNDEDRRFINFDLNLSAGSFMMLYEDDCKVLLKREMVTV